MVYSENIYSKTLENLVAIYFLDISDFEDDKVKFQSSFILYPHDG